jgi:hypothetical protein
VATNANKKSMEERVRAIETLGSACHCCGEKNKRFLDIECDAVSRSSQVYSHVGKNPDHTCLLICGNCKNVRKWYPDIFQRTSPDSRTSKFDIDLSYGKEREHRFSELIHSTIEVKSDRKANKTGNVYVEYESRGKPGGIDATCAETWAQEVDKDVFVVMPVQRMKELVRQRLEKYGPVLGGDGHTSKGVLLRVAELTRPIREE